jgi:hypothetical protein
MIEMWVDIVEDMTADVALKDLPHQLQELFIQFVQTCIEIGLKTEHLT